jgi:hypothetical protein
LHAPWYIAELFAVGYAPFSLFVIGLGWLAGAAQLVAVAGGRYAPYPSARERPPRGPVRELVRQVAQARRQRLRVLEEQRKALEG